MSHLSSSSVPLSELMILECSEFPQSSIGATNSQDFMKRNSTLAEGGNSCVKEEYQPSSENQADTDELADESDGIRSNGNLQDPCKEVPACSVMVCKGEFNSSLETVVEDRPKEQPLTNTLQFDPCIDQVFTFVPNQHHDLQEQGPISNQPTQNEIQIHQLQNNVGNTFIDSDWLQVLSKLLARSREKKQTNQHIKNLTLQEASSNQATHVITATSSQPPVILTSDLNYTCPEAASVSPDSVLRLPLAQITNEMPSKSRISSMDQTNVPKGQFVLLSSVSNTSDVSLTVHPLPSTKSGYSSLLHSKVKSAVRRPSNLNSSGEESQIASPLKVVATVQKSPAGKDVDGSQVFSIPLLENDPVLDQTRSGGPMRESHNMKERRRRARIKEACDLMRQLVPGMSHKTDKATVFEFSARYIHFLKTFVGTNNDKDFLMKYNPY